MKASSVLRSEKEVSKLWSPRRCICIAMSLVLGIAFLFLLCRALLVYSRETVQVLKVAEELRLAESQKLEPAMADQLRLVCYYVTPTAGSVSNDLRLKDVDASLCTHINLGVVALSNSTLLLSPEVVDVLSKEVPVLRSENRDLKLLLWIGDASTGREFSKMIVTHATRKVFIKSIKLVLDSYGLDGVDLDWEFPSAYKKERQHFSQLLYEIRAEFRRERKDRLLSVAVAAPEGIALYAYDVAQLNLYADYVNLMTYDYHFYSVETPFTGLNAPLYARSGEKSILGTLNINYSVNWWLSNGLDKSKLVVGLPTYGHSFTLVNPLNTHIGAPARGIGRCGMNGFASYSEICWLSDHSLSVVSFFDNETCSPYLSSGFEWISFESERSMECKTQFTKESGLGGVMIFSLNTDDTKDHCGKGALPSTGSLRLPLTDTAKRILSQD